MSDQQLSPARQVLQIMAFRHYLLARLFMTFAVNMLSTVVMWQVYKTTKDNFSVGLIGLAEFLPFVIVTLFAGYLADLVDRKKIIVTCIGVYSLAVFTLYLFSSHLSYVLISVGVVAIYAVNFAIGLIRGFLSPAQSAFASQLVPKEIFTFASNWLTMAWHIGSVGGPAAAGLVYALGGPSIAYLIIFGLVVIAFFLMLQVPKQALPTQRREPIFKSLGVGLNFVFKNQIILGAVSLDMFAVLFGGAVAMIPGYADQVLHVGEIGTGFLRAAPAIGAIIMGIIITKYPPTHRAGQKLLWTVAGFGIATVIFAVSTNFVLSFIALALTGFFDNMSMVIRATTIQHFTPNEMRGRVSSVESIFIGSSNELGAFESGVASRVMGLVPSVAFGGCMTLLVVATIAKLAPKLRTLDFGK